jgi:hypothetical protein
MHDRRTRKPVTPPIDVSPNNPCPFLRALVAEGFVDGHIVPLSTLSSTIGAASGEKGLSKIRARIEIYLVALVANGLSPFRLIKSWWSGAELDALRNGPLDKHGVGSRILDAHAHVHEDQIARLAEFGQECNDPSGGTERGLVASEITTFMHANFERAKDNRRWYDPLLMKGEWPVLLRIMGKDDGKDRYLSVAEVRTLFVDRRLPERIARRIESLPDVAPRRRALRVLGRARSRNFRIASGPCCPTSLRNCCRRRCLRRQRPGRPTGSTRTGRSRTGIGSTMSARAPRRSRCPTPGSSRWSSRICVCSARPD